MTPRLLFSLLTASLPLLAGATQYNFGWIAGAYVLLASPILDFGLRLRGRHLETFTARASGPDARVQRMLFQIYSISYLILFVRFVSSASSLPTSDLIQNIFSWSLMGGIPTLIAGHSMIHSRHRWDQFLGQALFIGINYPHFPFAHIRVHHIHVATRDDFHSAHRDQSYYRFLLSGLRREATHIGSQMKLSAKKTKAKTQLLIAELLRWVLIFGIAGLGGIRCILAYTVSTLIIRAVIWLVNYVQHYGLTRSSSGSFKERADHSWDVGHRSTNLLFFNAGLHAHHHMQASQSPSALALKSPMIFPYNFPMILIAALYPAHFFKKMNPLLKYPHQVMPASGTKHDVKNA